MIDIATIVLIVLFCFLQVDNAFVGAFQLQIANPKHVLMKLYLSVRAVLSGQLDQFSLADQYGKQ